MIARDYGRRDSAWTRADLWICLALLFATVALYSRVWSFEFVNYDDTEYVSKNPHILYGLSPRGIEWAFGSIDGANWIPAIRLSYLLEYQLFGLKSGAYHLTNLLLHVLASLLLFVFLRRATGARWPSAFVAFLFALHPLHVESVAWVTERKDVLSAVFWFLTLWAWTRYAERPAWRPYLPALLLFALGLMAKPMNITLPFVLLLLDAWPLRRTLSPKLLVEKLPFFALSGVSAVITYLAQRNAGAVKPLTMFPLGLRVENSLVTSIVYIAKMFWPSRLAIFYPYPKYLPGWQAVAAALVLAGVSALVLRGFRNRPWLAVGWFWYLGTLVPVIGLVQVGAQARADRYMYLPMVGLAIMLAWTGAEAIGRRPSVGRWVAALAAGALMALVPVTWIQLGYWNNSEALFRHAIDVTSGNQVAYLDLAVTLAQIPGRIPDALAVFEEGVRSAPNEEMHTNAGALLLAMNAPARLPAAIDHFRAALKIDPNYASAHSNLAVALLRMGRRADAMEEANAALRINPKHAAAHATRALILLGMGRTTEAMEEASTAVRIDPDLTEGHKYLGNALALQGRWDEAVVQFRQALRIAPNDAEAHNDLGFALGNIPGKAPEAMVELREAVRLRPSFRSARVNLGIGLSKFPGHLPEAIEQLRIALRIEPDPVLQKRLEQLEAQDRTAGR